MMCEIVVDAVDSYRLHSATTRVVSVSNERASERGRLVGARARPRARDDADAERGAGDGGVRPHGAVLGSHARGVLPNAAVLGLAGEPAGDYAG